MLAQQGQPWETLYGWLSERVVADFECDLPGLGYDDAWFTDADQVYRAWLTFENLGRGITKPDIFRVPSSTFVLSTIEQGGEVRFRLSDAVEPTCGAWLYAWDYPGNPYHLSEQLANRALVAAIVDAMMSYEHNGGSQEKASSFHVHAYVYNVCGHLLPAAVQDAYKEYLRLTFERFEGWVSTGTQSDLDAPSIAAMYITGAILGGDYPARAEAHADAFLDKHYKPAGYFDHGGGFDPGYNGWSILEMLWAYRVTGYERIREVLVQMGRLKAYLTLPDGGEWKSPSSFATSTAFGSATDQAWTYGRDVALSTIAPDAIPLRYTGRDVEVWRKPYGVVDEQAMRAQIASWTSRANNQEADIQFGKWTRPYSSYVAPAWSQTWHRELPNLAWELYPDSGTFYDEALIEETTPLPFDGPDFIEQFDDELVVWKLGGFGGVIHTGPLSWWQLKDGVALPGLSGGSIAALWSDKGGIGLLGRQAGYAGNTPDTLATMPTWAAHHVYGTKGGEQVSSGREEHPKSSIIIDGTENAMVMVSGLIGDSYYVRKFDISAAGLQVSLELDAAGFSELWESLPFYLGESEATDGQLQFLVDGLWIDATTEPVTATAAKLDRAGYITLMELEQPLAVRLSDHVWTTSYQVKSRIRSVQVDAMGGHVRYTLSGAYRQELVRA